MDITTIPSASVIHRFIKCGLVALITPIFTLTFSLSLFAKDITTELRSIEQQRSDYDVAKNMLDNYDLKGYRALRGNIADYPLTPYLDYRVFKWQLHNKTTEQVSEFIAQHNDIAFSTRLRNAYFDRLAKEKNWAEILRFQTQAPTTEHYQCLYHYAQLKTGVKTLAYQGAEKTVAQRSKC